MGMFLIHFFRINVKNWNCFSGSVTGQGSVRRQKAHQLLEQREFPTKNLARRKGTEKAAARGTEKWTEHNWRLQERALEGRPDSEQEALPCWLWCL